MLELRIICKSFPGAKALDNVSVTFAPGEVHALVGENGAGKSTLLKIITGLYQPDSGELYFDGKPLHFRSYRDSLRAGIDIVHQEIQVVPESTVAESIMINRMASFGRGGIIAWNRLYDAARAYMDMVDLKIPPGPRQIPGGRTKAPDSNRACAGRQREGYLAR
jgi:ribose transport system ATP-binding protein